MAQKTYVEEMAAFAVKADYGDLSENARAQLKLRVLDTIGCAIGALEGGPVLAVREQITEFGGQGPCTLIGMDGTTAPDRADFYNGALVRYVDFMDNYMGKKQSCHPSDNFASVLAAAEYASRSGKDFLASLALAYAVEIKLIDCVPAEEKGFDHTVQLAYSLAAGISRALGLDQRQTANALAISGTAFQGLVTSRSGYLTNWKGLASAMTALGVMNASFLAKRGITGPLQVLEGNNGLMEALGEKRKIEWSTGDLDAVTRTSVKAYNAEVHSQSAIEGMLELRDKYDFRGEDVEKIDVTTFRQVFNIIGEGEEAGDKHNVQSKEQADHSLPYLMAVAIIDGEVMPRQFDIERIRRDDVQELLKKVHVQTQLHVGKKVFEALDTYTQRYPEEMPCKIVIQLKGGRKVECEKSDYRGFFKRPMGREAVVSKFEYLAEPYTGQSLRSEIKSAVDNLDHIKVSDLTRLLAQARSPSQR